MKTAMSPHAAPDAGLGTPGGRYPGIRECLDLLAENVCLRLQFFRSRLAFRKLIFQSRILALQTRHVIFKNGNALAEDGGRSVFSDPFFNYVEWVHVARGLLWPFATAQGETPQPPEVKG